MQRRELKADSNLFIYLKGYHVSIGSVDNESELL